jgi:hypothetical protein
MVRNGDCNRNRHLAIAKLFFDTSENTGGHPLPVEQVRVRLPSSREWLGDGIDGGDGGGAQTHTRTQHCKNNN